MPEYAVKESVGAGRVARGLRRVAPFLAIAAVLGLAGAVLPAGLPLGGLVAGLVALSVIGLAVELRPATVLRVGADGMELEGRRMPWRTIGRVVVTRQDSDGYSDGEVGVSVGYRTHEAGSALPDVPLHTAVPASKANVGRLVRTVRAHALPHTEVREEAAGRPSNERAVHGEEATPSRKPYVVVEAATPGEVARRALRMARRWWATFAVAAALLATLRSGIVGEVWEPLLRLAVVLAGVVLLLVLAWGAWPKTVLRVASSGVELPVRSIPGLRREFWADKVPWSNPDVKAVTVPWDSIRQVVVAYPEPEPAAADHDQPVEIGLRPGSDAALPGHVAVRVTDLSDPLAIPPRLRVSVRRIPVDMRALVTAVRAYAPDSTTVVVARGGAEHVLG